MIVQILKTMQSRRSVRTFDGTPLHAEDAKAILDFAEKVENPYDIPIAWRMLDAKEHGLSSPVIVGTDTYIAGKLLKVPHAEEAFGYTFEKVVLFAESRGIGTTWIAGTMNRSAFEKAMHLSDGEVMPCVSPLGYPAKKMSLRESMMRKGIKADSRLPFETLFFDGAFDTPLLPEKAGAFRVALEAVRLAPSAVNRQPWRVVAAGDAVHFYEKSAKGYVSADGWDVRRIDMGIALAHFELAAKESGLFYMLHGDITYVDEALYANKLSVVFEDLAAARETLDRMREFVRNHPTVYCGTHTPQGYENLEANRVMDLAHPVPTVFAEVDFMKKEASGKYVCSICGYVYDPAEHDGVAFEDLPDDWKCPRCKQPKEKLNKA